MGVIVRGFKNALRNNIRALSIVFILAVSIGMSLVMLMSLKTVDGKIDSVKSSIGNTIVVSPAGVRGFEGGGELLTVQNSETIKNLANIKSVALTLSDRLMNENSTSSGMPGQSSTTSSKTSLNSAIEAGSFGNRQRRFSDNQSGVDSESRTPPSMPITVSGVNVLSSAALSISQFDVTSGEKIDPTSTDNVAMLGKDLATKNNLTVGSTFKAYDKDIKVIGIFDSGSTFTNGGIVMPLKTVQNLSGQTDQINSIIVETNSIDTVSTVSTAIKEKLGTAVDVTSQQDRSQEAIKPLENIKTISFYSLIGSLVAGAIIILLTMVMIARERRREIGVLKAIGASNLNIVTQFIAESLTLTFASAILGIILGLVLSNPVLKMLVNNSSESTPVVSSGGPMGGAGRMMREGLGGVQSTIGNLHNVVGWEIILYGFLAAVVIAIIGSAIPAYIIAKIRPAEVMRQE